MAEVDVIDLLSDPDFCDTFVVTRRSQVVDMKGRTQVAGERAPKIYGVVQPSGVRELQMMPDAVSLRGMITVWTPFRLSSASLTTEADIVTWQDNDYVVLQTQAYTNYGRGYVQAVCQMKDLLAEAQPSVPTDSGP